MKKFCIAFALILALLVLVGCKPPLAPAQQPNNNANTQKVYVCGAVVNEGYHLVEVGATLTDAIFKAQLAPLGTLPINSGNVVTQSTQIVFVNYVHNGATCSVTNVNGIAVTGRQPIANVSEQVVTLLANHIAQRGKICNKTQLKRVLGDLYDDNYYKFYIAESDFDEKAS